MISLEEREKRILNFKAAMWENGNQENLLRKAIESYEDTEAKGFPLADSEFYIEDKYVVVKNIPHIKNGQELFENLRLMVEIENELSKYKNLPEQIEFNDILYGNV